jgi:tetratricopeptide (TPR) repeat protein
MSVPRQIGLLLAGLAFACLAGWRIIATGLADRLANSAPERSLAWEPHNPTALLAFATRQIEENHLEAAAATARELLRIEPLSGEAFVILARAAEAAGDVAKASALYPIAVRRAPQNLYARAWVIEDLLRRSRYAEALGQYDTLFRVSSDDAEKFLPAFTQLSDASEFANVLAATLNTNPSWKAAMLSTLLARGGHHPLDQVFGDLQRTHNLPDEDAGKWLDRLMQDGFWGEAYGRWVGELQLTAGAALPMLYNGGFETEPSGIGFDWRIRPTVGVTITRAFTRGAIGNFAIDVGFSGRRVPEINLEQRLFLGPGAYKLSFRARADALRSDKGLQWAIQCNGKNEPLATSEALGGSFGWKHFETPFVIPGDDCSSQRIWLRNPGAAAAGKEVIGDIWFDDLAITSGPNPR